VDEDRDGRHEETADEYIENSKQTKQIFHVMPPILFDFQDCELDLCSIAQSVRKSKL
jgi:hypothetical protein